MALNVEKYLERISFHEEVQTNLSTLADLHRQHILTIPFENLDIHYGRKIALDLDRIEQKVIANSRGGFCYELNGLFGALLSQLGFDVRILSARVIGKEKIGREFDHLILLVGLEQDWLVDVGFGENFIEPIQMAVGKEQRDPTGFFRITRYDSTYHRLESNIDGSGYSPKYLFSLADRQIEDFSEMCEYHQNSPLSSFTQERVCTLATVNGRVTLRDHALIETINGHKSVTRVAGEPEFTRILKDRFGIEILNGISFPHSIV
jgi:N-hydroxyarylamine O-acetyltransferase